MLRHFLRNPHLDGAHRHHSAGTLLDCIRQARGV